MFKSKSQGFQTIFHNFKYFVNQASSYETLFLQTNKGLITSIYIIIIFMIIIIMIQYYTDSSKHYYMKNDQNYPMINHCYYHN